MEVTNLARCQFVECSYNHYLCLEDFLESNDGFDGWVHCIGAIHPQPIKYLNEAGNEGLFQVNYFSATRIASALLKRNLLKSKASIVFISSVSSHYPYRGGSAYAASKAALETFAKGLAQAWILVFNLPFDTSIFYHIQKGAKATRHTCLNFAVLNWSMNRVTNLMTDKKVVHIIGHIIDDGKNQGSSADIEASSRRFHILNVDVLGCKEPC
jgi:hypothetical protein